MPGTTQEFSKDFPGGPVVSNPPANAGNTSEIAGPTAICGADLSSCCGATKSELHLNY